jgi:selenide,water dikinase
VGLDRPDDAGVYRISDDLALVQTLDFITPIVDDPETFGRIAAANSLSDVWTMGGRPVCAMNVVCFPACDLDLEVLRSILSGGAAALEEAEVALVGGHSVEDPELKFGLSVTGLVHPGRFLTSRGARPGDALVLTKPLGTGIVGTAIKGGLASPGAEAAAAASMSELNRFGAERMLEHGARACTDVTGFGLAGHALEMLAPDGPGLELDAGALPLLPGVEEAAGMGLLPAGLSRNREHYAAHVEIAPEVPSVLADAVHDPQTSGGLLVGLSPEGAEALVAELRAEGNVAAAIVGRFTGDHPGKVRVRAG